MVASQGSTPIPLQCPVQHYAWGSGSGGLVARLSNISSSQPCAELWMGTHPSAPSKILPQNTLLSEHINRQLPFLFKVLSVNTALSIQAHPDKILARVLHAQDPKNYPDDNHKPEMAIALTEFEALCAFRLQREIEEFWTRCPELMFLTRISDIRTMFSQVMHCDREKYCMVAEKIMEKANDCPTAALFKKLWTQYPNDVGCFCVFLLNYIKLQQGEAIFLTANEPHAYISGDCVETMATSDNTVRAGLTPKHRDLSTLISMLTYRQIAGRVLVLNPKVDKGGLKFYSVPVSEFAVASGNIVQGESIQFTVQKAGIVIFISGNGHLSGQEYKPGSIFYLPSSEYKVEANDPSSFYMAFEP
jgi:mannose-6-phosphate isomerase